MLWLYKTRFLITIHLEKVSVWHQQEPAPHAQLSVIIGGDQTLAEQHIVQIIHVDPVPFLIAYGYVTYAPLKIVTR